MTLSSRFFSDGSEYYQPDFAKLMKDSVIDGYIEGEGTECKVIATPTPSMTVHVGIGRLYIQGYSMDVADDPYLLTLDPADFSNPRIDRIVARLSVSTSKNIILDVLKGTPESRPSPPALTRGLDIYEISLAQIRVNAGVGYIDQSNITDERIKAYPLRHNQIHAKNGVDEIYLDGTQITSGYVPDDRLKKASKSGYGIVKVGDGISVSADGTISIPFAPFPIMARMYGTDKGFGTLILNNVYNGVLGQKPQGITLQNEHSSSDMHQVTFTAHASNLSASRSVTNFEYTFYALNVFTLAKRTLGTAGGSGSGGAERTVTQTYSLYLEEIGTHDFADHSGWNHWSDVGFETDACCYLGRPIT